MVIHGTTLPVSCRLPYSVFATNNTGTIYSINRYLPYYSISPSNERHLRRDVVPARLPEVVNASISAGRSLRHYPRRLPLNRHAAHHRHPGKPRSRYEV